MQVGAEVPPCGRQVRPGRPTFEAPRAPPALPGGTAAARPSMPARMGGLIPLLCALVIAASADSYSGGASVDWRKPTLVAALGLVLWPLIALGAGILLRRLASRRLMLRADAIGDIAILTWFAWLCLGLHWPCGWRSSGLAILPWIVAQLGWWWGTAPIVARLDGVAWSRLAWTWHQARMVLVPVLIILPVSDLAIAVFASTGYEAWLKSHNLIGISQVLGMAALGILAITLFPLLILRLWGARRMQPSELTEDLTGICQRAGVKVAGLMHWPVPGGRMLNAAVLGGLPRIRYVLFTDDLLRGLSRRELVAVLGHELGHARHGHLWTYLLFFCATMLVGGQFAETLQRSLAGQAWIDRFPPEVVGTLITLALILIQFRVLFGWVSRLCEREADLAGVEISGDPAAMQDALKAVARLSGQSEDLPNWRHHSIRERVDFLDQVRRQPILGLAHHQLVRSFRSMLLLLVLVFSLSAGWDLYHKGSGAGTAQTAATDLQAWQQREPDLNKALEDADRGEAKLLLRWITEASPTRRRYLAELLIKSANGPDDAESVRTLYRMRHRLAAFHRLGTGDPKVNLKIDNVLAYGLAAGAEQLSAEETDLLRDKLVRLDTALKTNSHHAIWDTVGCIHYRLGNYQRAKESFASARSQLPRDLELPEPDRKRSLDLYNQREAAAVNALHGLPPAPLPMMPAPAAVAPALPATGPSLPTAATPTPSRPTP